MGEGTVRFQVDLFPGNSKIGHIGTIYRRNNLEDLIPVGPAFSRDGNFVWFQGACESDSYVLIELEANVPREVVGLACVVARLENA